MIVSEKPIVSVVVPLYNKGKTIRRTLDAIIGQTVGNIEIVVVDDGSTDGSAEIVEEVRDSRIRLIRQLNSGVSQARNNGVRQSRCDLIAFIDADDEWTPVHLENILKASNRFPRCGIYATNYSVVMPDGSLRHPRFHELQPEDGFCLIRNYFKTSKTSSVLSCSSIALTREVFLRIGGFPVTETVKEDHCLYAKIALDHQIGFAIESTAVYRMDAENRTGSRIDRLGCSLKDCDLVLLGIINGALSQRNYRNPYVSITDIQDYRKKVYFWRASDLIRIGQQRKGRSAALRLLVTQDYFLRSVKLIIRSFCSD